MGSRNESAEKSKSNPYAAKSQELVNSSTDGWDKCWEQGLTPWDLGKPTPVIMHLLQTGALPSGRVLVPGCGSGYDVVALASPERYVVGLDVSENAIINARELFSMSPNSNYFTFLTADFFTWNPTELFDLIFDYTFFCAFEPCKRPAWANHVQELLKPDGELITLVFPISDHVGGPPYKVSVADYKEVLHPIGFEAVFIEDNNLAIESRKNYTGGNPTTVLYIKNLAKDDVVDDFYFIFGSLFGSVEAVKSGISVKLMQANCHCSHRNMATESKSDGNSPENGYVWKALSENFERYPCSGELLSSPENGRCASLIFTRNSECFDTMLEIMDVELVLVTQYFEELRKQIRLLRS